MSIHRARSESWLFSQTKQRWYDVPTPPHGSFIYWVPFTSCPTLTTYLSLGLGYVYDRSAAIVTLDVLELPAALHFLHHVRPVRTSPGPAPQRFQFLHFLRGRWLFRCKPNGLCVWPIYLFFFSLYNFSTERRLVSTKRRPFTCRRSQRKTAR